MENRLITLVITSFNREDLLFQTYESFLRFNTYPIKRTIIIDDSGQRNPIAKFREKYPKVEYIINEKNEGQIPSIVKAYSTIDTEFIFHCEDDWEFYHDGFIEESIEILDKEPRCLQLWLRDRSDTNGHPINGDKMVFKYAGRWHGFTFNPGLKRMKNYVKYSLLTRNLGKSDPKAEAEIGKHYYNRGFYAKISKQGYVRHIGGNQPTKSMIWSLDDAKEQHAYSPKLAELMDSFCPKDIPVIDLGCGKGTYLKYLSERGFDCHGFEGTADILEIADFDNIKQADLSKPLKTKLKGTVISFEVVEHIEPEFEEQFIKNIDKICNGTLMLSWAVKGQGGHGHVNEQNEDYVLQRFEKLGYKYDAKKSEVLRYEAGKDLWWFKKSIYFFTK